MKVQNTADWGNFKKVSSRKSHNAIEQWLFGEGHEGERNQRGIPIIKQRLEWNLWSIQ